MSVENVLPDMKTHIKSHIDLDPTENGWSSEDYGRTYHHSNGSEIYIFRQRQQGFLISKHDDGERKRLFRSDEQGIPAGSPLAIAYLEHVLKNVEEFVRHYNYV